MSLSNLFSISPFLTATFRFTILIVGPLIGPILFKGQPLEQLIKLLLKVGEDLTEP